MKLGRILPLLPVSLLAACAQPVTMTPGVSKQEVATEAAVHEQAVQAAKKVEAGSKTVMDRQTALNGLNAVAQRVLPAATQYCQQFTGGNDCGFSIALDKDDAPLNAYANGKQVVVSPAMIAFTQTPDELAVVVSHEMAHNILQHPQKSSQNAMIGGLGGTLIDMAAAHYGLNPGISAADVGQQIAVARYSQDFERDADYLGIYIESQAGYDPNVAPAFWQRMSVNDPNGIYSSGSHPANPERAVMLRKAIAEINTKKQAGQPLVPNLRTAK